MNDRKEVEGIKWGSGTVLNAAWRGVPLRSLLLHLGLPANFETQPKLLNAHVHFTAQQECEQASTYGASIPLRVTM